MSGPFAAYDADESGSRFDFDDVVASDFFGAFTFVARYKRAGACEASDDLIGCDGSSEIFVELAEHEIDVSLGDIEFVAGLNFGFRGTDEETAAPGNGEEDTAIVRLGDEHGHVGGEELHGQEDVSTLAETHPIRNSGRGHAADRIGGGPGGVDDDFGVDGEILFGKLIRNLRAGEL